MKSERSLPADTPTSLFTLLLCSGKLSTFLFIRFFALESDLTCFISPAIFLPSQGPLPLSILFCKLFSATEAIFSDGNLDRGANI